MDTTVTIVTVGSARVDLRSGIIERDGEPVLLRAKSFALLRLLIQNAGRIVTRDEIIATIWDGRVITDDALNQTVRDVRRVVGGSADALRTVPKRGYVLTLPDPPAATGRLAPAREATAPEAPAPAIRRKPTVAVARFSAIGAEETLADLARGLADDIVAQLSRMQAVRVVPHAPAAGADAGSDYVLEGSVRRFGDRVRITGYLTDVLLGMAIWGDQLDGDAANAAEVLDRMAAAAVAGIESGTRLSEIEKAQRASINEADAYALLMRAIPMSTRNSLAASQEAVELLGRSLALDPGNATAHGYKAWAHQQLYFRGGFHEYDREAALLHGEAAVRLGPSDPQALAMGGFVQGFIRNDFSGAIVLLDRALALSPNSPLALRFSALMNAFSYRIGRATSDALTALRLAPLDPMNYHVHVATAFCALAEERWSDVAEQAAAGIAVNPDFPVMHAWLAAGLYMTGRQEEAREAVRRLRAIAPAVTVASLSRMGFMRPLEDRLAPVLLEVGMTAA